MGGMVVIVTADPGHYLVLDAPRHLIPPRDSSDDRGGADREAWPVSSVGPPSFVPSGHDRTMSRRELFDLVAYLEGLG